MTAAVPRRQLHLGPHDVVVERRADGSSIVRSPHALAPFARCMTDRLAHWAAHRPDSVFLAERDGEDWRTITYGDALNDVRSAGQALLDRGCTPARGVAILSGNGIDHALVALGAQYVGIPYVPVSPPYALVSTDFEKLRHVLGVFDPAIVFVNDAAPFARAIAAAVDPRTPVVAAAGSLATHATIPLDELLSAAPRAVVDRANAAVGPDTIAKILFTSGSTGLPKGVINTQRMLCSNQVMTLAAFPFLCEGELVMLDWAPWNHTAGSNQTFGMTLYNGGTMYIDDGKPTLADMHKTVRNIRDVAPTIYFNVPKGYEALTALFDDDAELRDHFFSRMQMMWYAGAALSAPVFEHVRRLAHLATGEEILITSGLGSTETAPSATFANWYGARSGNIGLPTPGVELKLVPTGGKLEMRVRGPNITPGYLHRDDLTRAAFDDEGFYRMGDALRQVDPDDVQHGYVFDGRIGDDFKLATGTWVSVGPLRAALLTELDPVVRDLVLCGLDANDITALLVGDGAAARRACGLGTETDDAAAFAHESVRAFVRAGLERHAARSTGSSTRVVRAIFLDSPPMLDAGEITDKGSLNASVVRTRRAHLIEHLYADVPNAAVIAIG